MKKKKWIIALVLLILLIPVILYLALLMYPAMYPAQLTEFNTLYAKDFNVDIWETEVDHGMTQSQIKALIGEPLNVDTERRCDFYTEPRTKWLKFKEYKVCYDAEYKFFLKLKFEYGIDPLFSESYF